MGCFDFTYADNGENIRGQRGYVYISKAMQKATGLSSPMRFTSTDEYGVFDFDIKGQRVALDIYAIYAAQLALAGIIDESKPIQKYVGELRRNAFADRYDTEQLEELIRCEGIEEFFGTMHDMPTVSLTVKALANQHEKAVDCNRYTDTRLPILITRKKLPYDMDDDITDIARNWGFVSTQDPNQGWAPTHNLYCQYRPRQINDWC